MKPLYPGLRVGYFNGARGYEPRAPLPSSVYRILCIGIGFDDEWINRFQGILAVNIFQLPVEIEQLKLAERLSCCTGKSNPIQLSTEKAV